MAGSTGENLTIGGLDWAALNVGDQLQIGDQLRIEITGYAAPCSNIIASFAGGAITRISQKLHPAGAGCTPRCWPMPRYVRATLVIVVAGDT